MKTTMHFERLIEPVSFRIAWLIRRACTPTLLIAHLAFQFGFRRQGRDRVDHDHADRARTDQRVDDLQRLLARCQAARSASSSRSTPSFLA